MEMDSKTPAADFWLLTEKYCLHAPLFPSYHPGEFLDFLLVPYQIYLVFAGLLSPSAYSEREPGTSPIPKNILGV